jgi:hypothetical protein
MLQRLSGVFAIMLGSSANMAQTPLYYAGNDL